MRSPVSAPVQHRAGSDRPPARVVTGRQRVARLLVARLVIGAPGLAAPDLHRLGIRHTQPAREAIGARLPVVPICSPVASHDRPAARLSRMMRSSAGVKVRPLMPHPVSLASASAAVASGAPRPAAGRPARAAGRRKDGSCRALHLRRRLAWWRGSRPWRSRWPGPAGTGRRERPDERAGHAALPASTSSVNSASAFSSAVASAASRRA